MKKQITISGFGGQGVMSIGKSLVEAAVAEGLHATWVPSYGPEMRGGTANCEVVLSVEPVGSPVFTYPTELIAMNRPSLHRFEEKVQPGGIIFVNSSIIEDKVQRTDVKSVYVPCDTIADELGNKKVSNMVMLGAYIAATGVLKEETIRQMLIHMFTGPKAKLVDLNMQALERGAQCPVG